jgi:transcriptional regulator with XRE-family HTH domain
MQWVVYNRDMDESLAGFIKRTREAFGPWMSQAELGRRAGVSSATISRLEAGEVAAEQATVEKIAEALGVPRDDLLALAGFTALRTSPRPIVLPVLPPLEQIERALHAGPWKPEVRAAVFTLLRETAQV